MKSYVGIDLGTTDSTICSYDAKRMRFLKTPEQSHHLSGDSIMRNPTDSIIKLSIVAAIVLASIAAAPIVAGQSLDAAPVRADGNAVAKREGPVSRERTVPLLVVDLGPFEGGIEALKAMTGNGPPVTGLHRPVPSEHSGDIAPEVAWTGEATDGSVTGAFAVCSRGAQSVRVRIAARLPDEATLTVRNEEGGNARGGWTGADVAEDGEDGAWLPDQTGECLTVEVMLPRASDAEVSRIWLRSVAHRFTPEELEEAQAAQGGSQGSADQAVPKHGSGGHRAQCPARYVSVCDRLEPSVEVSRHATAVAHYHFESTGGSRLCSGTLLNDGRDGGSPVDPLLLTAAHCIASAAEARSMDVVFDWIPSECSPEPQKQVNGPSRLLASAREYDQTLVQLAHWPAPHTVVGRWALGWNAGMVEPGTRTRTLSHPGGAVLAFTAAVTTGVSRQPVAVRDYGLVYNSIETNERDGMTEPGSSGSALVKPGPEGHIIGVLSYGPSDLERGLICLGLAEARSGYGGFRDFFPRIAHIISTETGPVVPPRNEYAVPFVLRAHTAREAFVRLSPTSPTRRGFCRFSFSPAIQVIE